MVVVPGSVIDAGDIAHVLPAGPPLHDNDTAPANPFCPVTVTVYVALLPTTFRESGETDSAKSMTFSDTAGDVLGLKSVSPL